MKKSTMVLLALLAFLSVNMILVGNMAYGFSLINSQPVTLDQNGRMVFKPGLTIPGRSIDAAGEGLTYHFTRYDSYKAPDWRPKSH